MKNLRLFSLAALLVTGVAAGATAAGNGANNGGSSQVVTGTQLGSQQEGTPATGSAPNATTNQFGQAYPGRVGPTGSHQPDATNPVRSNPSGGGGEGGNGAGGGGGSGSGGNR